MLEDFAQQVARVRVVVDREDPHVRKGNCARRVRPVRLGVARWRRYPDGQPNDKCRALSDPVAARLDGPAVQLDEMTGERQPDAQAAVLARRSSLALAEP